jgi:hypothetical protein
MSTSKQEYLSEKETPFRTLFGIPCLGLPTKGINAFLIEACFINSKRFLNAGMF